MELVLRADVDGVGKKGDLVDVADGYARNFLLPKGRAFKAPTGAHAQAEAMRRSRDIKDAAARAAAEDVAKTLVPTTITVTAKTGARRPPLRVGHHVRDRRGDRGPDGHRDRSSQAAPRRADQDARHPHGARQAAQPTSSSRSPSRSSRPECYRAFSTARFRAVAVVTHAVHSRLASRNCLQGNGIPRVVHNLSAVVPAANLTRPQLRWVLWTAFGVAPLATHRPDQPW